MEKKKQEYLATAFQFLIGRLRTICADIARGRTGRVSILIGRLRTVVPHPFSASIQFQFLIGRLRTPGPKQMRPGWPVSIPHR